jgi:hypothetical protein
MLLQQIDEDLKTALKAKDETVSSSLRNLKAAIKNVEIEKSQALTDDEVLAVIAKKVKQHKDSIESFQAGNRADLVSYEQAQMQVLQKYLPKQMDETELTGIVKTAIATLKAGPADFGKVMKEVVTQVRGRAEGNAISKIVKENLK